MLVRKLSLLGIYHPPQSSNQTPDSIFIDKLGDAVQEIAATNNNLIITSDLNIHINDLSDNDANILLDALSSLGLTQLVKSATHNSGNTLDHFYVEDPELAMLVVKCGVSDFLSDHCWVVCEFNITKLSLKKEKVETQKLNVNYEDQLRAFTESTSLLSINDAKTLFEEYNQQLKNLYNTIAPPKLSI